MSLPGGARLGPYEIVAPIGAGGMGEVYRARDTRLNRYVAIKTLPDAFAMDRDRLARFQREAQVLASLNHPNIGAIHGFEESGGGHALVLELVEGETLAEYLHRVGALPVEEALTIARQVCDAVEAAHDLGIVHRDLKPANIKVTPAGVVKVLDFGLAKLAGAAAGVSQSEVMASPTMTAVSMPGMLIGTAAYMSPEQAKGRDADRTADVWAFGCVLYEMLAGRRPFEGGSPTEIISEVIKSEPDWARLPADTPVSIRRLLRRCLTKDPRRRLQHIGDARLEIDDAGTQELTTTGSGWTRSRWMLTAAALGIVAAIATASAVIALRDRGGAGQRGTLTRLHLHSPEGVDDVHFLTMSPTGRELALVGSTDNSYAVFIRSMASLEARRVATMQERRPVFWSPDGRSLGFFDGGQLKIVDVATGQTRVVCDAPEAFGGSWGADDTIIFTPAATGGVHRVSARGGPSTEITVLDRQRGEESHRWPQFLPGGRRFIFLGWSSGVTAGDVRYTVKAAELGSSSSTPIVGSTSAAIYDPAGYLLFALDAPQRLVALPFDAGTATANGSQVTIAEDLSYDWITGSLPVTSTNDGTLLYLNDRPLQSRLTWFDRSGREIGTLGDPGVYYDPAFNRDGTSVLVEQADPAMGAGDVWRVDIALGTFSRLTHEPTFDNVPVWSPDGKRFVYSSDRDGVSHVFVRNADGSDQPTKILGEPGVLSYASDWSADGRYLLVTSITQQRNRDVWVVPMTGGEKPRPLLQSPFHEEWATLSPDGRSIAYTSTESGVPQVYLRAWPSLTGSRQVSARGGGQPRWSGDGRELFYGVLDGGIMAAPISYGNGDAQIGTPVYLFNPDVEMRGLRNRFAVAPDGQRFLVIKPLADRRSSSVTVIVDWPALLRAGS